MARADALRVSSADFEDVADLIDALGTEVSDEWIAVNETWTYASTSTITVPTDATTRFQKGDKLKFTNSTVKYVYIINVAATLLTVTGGDDYAVANTTISSIYVSRADRPLGFPAVHNYTATATGFSAAPTNVVSTFFIHNGHCVVDLTHGTAGTSDSTSFSVLAPITAATVTNMVWGICGNLAVDNGSTLTAPPGVQISSAASSIVCTKTIGASAASWTASSTKRIRFTGLRYKI